MSLYKSLILLILLLVSSSSILAFKYAFFLFLKYPVLHCSDYLHCFGFDPVSTVFYPASSHLKYLNIPHQTMVYAASFPADLGSLAEVLMVSLMLSQALFMSSSSL